MQENTIQVHYTPITNDKSTAYIATTISMHMNSKRLFYLWGFIHVYIHLFVAISAAYMHMIYFVALIQLIRLLNRKHVIIY